MTGTHDGRRPAILAFDTATTHVVVATGSPAGVTLEAAFVRFGGRPPVAIPLGDLERFA